MPRQRAVKPSTVHSTVESRRAARGYVEKKGGSPNVGTKRGPLFTSGPGGGARKSPAPAPSAESSPARRASPKDSGLRSRMLGRPSTALFAEEALTLTALVAYDMTRRTGTKLPRPGPILSTLAFYALLAVVGSFTDGAARVVAAVGGVVTLTVMVSGVRGQGLVNLLRNLTGQTQVG